MGYPMHTIIAPATENQQQKLDPHVAANLKAFLIRKYCAGADPERVAHFFALMPELAEA